MAVAMRGGGGGGEIHFDGAAQDGQWRAADYECFVPDFLRKRFACFFKDALAPQRLIGEADARILFVGFKRVEEAEVN